MMSEDPTPKAKRTKINASTVHAEFKAAKIQHPRTKAWIEGSVCNHCGDEIPGKTATNLKSHLGLIMVKSMIKSSVRSKI